MLLFQVRATGKLYGLAKEEPAVHVPEAWTHHNITRAGLFLWLGYTILPSIDCSRSDEEC